MRSRSHRGLNPSSEAKDNRNFTLTSYTHSISVLQFFRTSFLEGFLECNIFEFKVVRTILVAAPSEQDEADKVRDEVRDKVTREVGVTFAISIMFDLTVNRFGSPQGS